MATEFVVMLPPSEAHHCDPVIEAMEGLDAIEAALTIYRDSSEIAKLNRRAGDRPVPVTQSTFALLQRAIRWSERTEGAFDITAGPLVEVWGFTRRSGRKPTDEEIDVARQKVGYRFLTLNAENRTVRFAKPGMSINLGGIGKGDALDRLASDLCAAGIENFLIHGGNSSVVACGDQSLDSGKGWAVGIAHPTKPSRRLGGIWLRNAALATSGSGKQFFHHRGRRYGHVIDPRTGYPAGDLLSLTVIADSAADADAAATGYFVAGAKRIAADDAAEPSPTFVTAMVAAKPGKRQDEVELMSIGSVNWVEED
jgi:thiamine biosynthesis lipoprotein